MHDEPSVVAVVVTWNSAKFIAECLESLLNSRHSVQVIVIDNDSKDDTVRTIQERYPQITIVASGSNLGYAGGNNLGIRLGLDRDADYLFVLNPDANIDRESIGRLVQRMEDDPGLAIASPMIYFSGSDIIWYAGSIIDWKTGRTPHQGAGEKDEGAYDAVTLTDRASGCAMLVRSSLIREVGFLDERYFLYYEEADWSVRFSKSGYRIGFVPLAKVWHAISSSTGGYEGTIYQYYMLRNQLLFMKKHSTGSFTTFLLRFLAQISLRATVLARRSSLKTSWQYVQTCRAACGDFFHHRFGIRADPIA